MNRHYIRKENLDNWLIRRIDRQRERQANMMQHKRMNKPGDRDRMRFMLSFIKEKRKAG